MPHKAKIISKLRWNYYELIVMKIKNKVVRMEVKMETIRKIETLNLSELTIIYFFN